MTRTARLKALYLLELTILGVTCGAIVHFAPPEQRWLVLVVMAVLLFIPGRIQGWLLRHHFRGRRLADRGQYAESMAESEAFLRQVRQEPWRKRAVWLAGVVHSPDIEAMTWNNHGIAALHAGEYDKAEASLHQALALDPEYPIPHVNLAVLARVRGDETAASHHVAEAARLGYHGTNADAVMAQAQRILAAVEGGGERRPPA